MRSRGARIPVVPSKTRKTHDDTQSCLVFSAIAPHPPIMVPEVGRESIAGVVDSIDAMAELTRRLIDSGAESVVLISPHAPLEADSFVAYEGPEVYGDFSNFHAPETYFAAKVDEELLAAIKESRSFRKLRRFDAARARSRSRHRRSALFSAAKRMARKSGHARLQLSFKRRSPAFWIVYQERGRSSRPARRFHCEWRLESPAQAARAGWLQS